jgi:hypothetical protein
MVFCVCVVELVVKLMQGGILKSDLYNLMIIKVLATRVLINITSRARIIILLSQEDD